MIDQTSTWPRVRVLASIAALTFGPLACTDDTVGMETGPETGSETGSASPCGLFVGDLVISEIVANVEGADAGLEWFEIYNASAQSQDLEGLTLVYENSNGSGRKEHVVARGVELPAGGYVVVSGITDELTQGIEHLDYGYADDLGEFANGGGYLALECGTLIDEVYYEEVSDTASRTLSSTIAPDATANDNLENWCDSRTPFLEDFAATPRAPNDVCSGSGSCAQDGVLTETIPPQLGELVITELFQDPKTPLAEGDAEWFELYNAGDSAFHLNGVEFGKDPEEEADDTVVAADCILIEPGAFALIAQGDAPLINGGLPQPDYVTSEGLSNSASSLWVGVDGVLLDLVTWSDTSENASYTLDPGSYDVAANDGELNWCEASELMFGQAFGTPKAANEECPPPPPEEGECYEDGVIRDIVPFAPGDLEIVELMPNPECVSDSNGEWFELYAKSEGDLNGLQIGKAGSWETTIEVLEDLDPNECFSVSPGDHVLVAHLEDPELNGGLPPVDALFNMALNNGNSDLIIGYGPDPAMPDDQISWVSTTPGAALSKDSNGEWCDAVDEFSCGLGTPGEPNPECGGNSDTCIDPDDDSERMIVKPEMGQLTLSEVMPNPSTGEPTGEWFELHASATFDLNGLELGKNMAVAHTVNSEMCIEVEADGYVVLARSDLNECMLPQVDYVYAGPNLSNGGGNNIEIGYDGVIWDSYTWENATTDGVARSYDPMAMSWCDAVDAFGCGDLATPGAANPPCGMNNGGMCLDGNVMRPIVTPDPGQLIISEFMANPDAVSDAVGEWFEIHALASFDLNELELGRAFVDGSIHTIDAVQCLALNEGDHALLARDADPVVNGGMDNVDYVYSALGLTNSNSALHVADGDILLDEIGWSSTSAGESTSLEPSVVDPGLNDAANNADPNWCYASELFGDGDAGTPGIPNPVCE